MDLELGLKITHTVDDHVSFAKFRIANNKSTPLFVSKETESTLILTALLKGYRRENVDIDINEDGTRIGISGEKPVQEKVMVGWMMQKKEVEIRGFRKVFRIPDGVVLDRIKAKFNEHQSTLTIVMPKSVRGIQGVGIEEVKEDGADIGKQQMTQPAAEEFPQKDGLEGKIEEEIGEPKKKRIEENRHVKGKGVDEEESKKEIVADGVLHKDRSGSKIQEEAKDSKTASMKDITKSVSENSEEPKIAEIEEPDGIEKEKVGRTEQTVADYKVPKSEGAKEINKGENSTEVTHEVFKPSHETQVTKHPTEKPELPELEEPIKEGPENYHHSKDEIEEAEKNEDHIKEKGVDKRDSSEVEEQKDAGEKSSDHVEKKPALEKSSLLCSPFIIAGSALIVSLVMLALNKIRTRKR